MKPSMKPSKDIRSEHEPPIRRHTGATAATSLGRLVTEAALQRRLEDTQRSVEQNAMKAAALRPILDLIHADDAAAEAADRLRKMMRQFPPRTQRLASGAGASPPQPASVTIGPGVTVFTHPYDHAQVGPDTAVNEHSSSAQVLSGTLHVDGWAVDFLEWDGGFFAIAGLGLDLETRRDVIALRWRGRIDISQGLAWIWRRGGMGPWRCGRLR